MSRLLSIVLIALGALFAITTFAQFGQLSSGYDPEWANASIADLEYGKAPEADFVRIRDGMLFWPAMILTYEEHLRTKETRERGAYVPLVSRTHGEALWNQLLEDGTADFSHVAAFVFLDQDRLDREFPGVSTARELDQNLTPYVVEGLIRPGSDLPSHVTDYLAEEFPSMRLSKLAYVSQGVEPVTAGAAILSAIFTFLVLAGGFRLRSHARAERERAVLNVDLPAPAPRLFATTTSSAS